GLSMSTSKRSSSVSPRASTTRRTRSQSSTAWWIARAIRRWIARFARVVCPGVSTKTAWSPSRLRTPRILCRVVCGFGLTMLIFSPTSALSSVDLPTFGRPTIATYPQRLSPPYSGLVTGELREHRRRGILLGEPTAAASPDRFDVESVHSTEHREHLLVIAPLDVRDRVGRQRETAALQPFLQPRLRVLELCRRGQALEPRREQPVDEPLGDLAAAVEQHGPDHRFDRVGDHGGALRPARAQLPFTEHELTIDADLAADLGERRLVHERRTRPAQVALARVGPRVVKPPGDREIQKRVSKKLEPLVVVLRRAAVRQRALEQLGVREVMMQIRLGPTGASGYR